jgi:hypothetical protein
MHQATSNTSREPTIPLAVLSQGSGPVHLLELLHLEWQQKQRRGAVPHVAMKSSPCVRSHQFIDHSATNKVRGSSETEVNAPNLQTEVWVPWRTTAAAKVVTCR